MDFRNKYLVITLRSLFGLALIALGVLGLFMDPPTEGMTPAMLAALQGMDALGIAKLIAVIELAAGLMLVTGFLPAFGVLLFVPIEVGILAVHIAKELNTILPGLIFGLITAYFGYVYWDKYKALFTK
ncbi:MAG: hypothetical protein AABX98_04175 [Nanoarchaeota archaeon]